MRLNNTVSWMFFCLVLLSMSACSKSNLESTIDMPAAQAPVDGPSENNELSNLDGSFVSVNKEITPDNIDKLTVLRQFGKGTAYDIALSPDGRHLAVGAYDGIYIYSVPDLAEENFFSAGSCHEIVFSSDGKFIAAIIARKERHAVPLGVIVFNVESGKELWNAFFEDSVYGLTLSPDNQIILVEGERSLDFLDAKSGKILNTYEDPMQKTLSIQGLSFSNDSSMLAINSGDTLHYIDAQSLTELSTVRLQHDFETYGKVAFSPDFQYLVKTQSSSVRVWNAQTGDQLWAKTDLHQVSSRIFSKDGRSLALGCGDQYIVMVDSATGSPLQIFQGEVHSFGNDQIWGLDFSTETKIMVTLSLNEILVWDLNTGMEIGSLKEHGLGDAIAAISPDGKLVAAGYESGLVRVWNVDSGKLVWEKESVIDEWHEAYSVEAIKFSSNGKTLMANYLSADQNFRVLDSSNGSELGLFEVTYPAEPSFFNGNTIDLTIDGFIDKKSGQPVIDYSEFEGRQLESWALSHDGSSLAAYSWSYSKEVYDFSLKIWDTATGEVISTVNIEPAHYSMLQFSPDGKILAGNYYDGTNRIQELWDVESGEKIQTFTANESEFLLFSPDGQTIFLVKFGESDGRYFSRWSIKDGSMICKSENVSLIINFTLSSNGDLVTFYEYLDSLTIWDAKNCKLLRDMGLEANSATFSEDGKHLLTAASLWGDAVQLWGIP